MKSYWGSGCKAPPILNLSSRWRRVFNFTPRSLNPREKSHRFSWLGGWMGPRSGLDTVANRKISNPYQKSNSGLLALSLVTLLTELPRSAVPSVLEHLLLKIHETELFSSSVSSSSYRCCFTRYSTIKSEQFRKQT
jgi:hypothetical protein